VFYWSAATRRRFWILGRAIGHPKILKRRRATALQKLGRFFADGPARVALAGASQRLANGAAESVHVESQLGKQLAALGVLDEAVGNAEADNVALAASRRVRRFQHRAAEPALERAFLHGHDERRFLQSAENRRLVERLGEASIDDADVEALFAQLLGGFHA